MNFIESIRIRMHQRFLRKELAAPRRACSTVYLENAKTVGILFDATQLDEREIVLGFARQLEQQGKAVKLLAFFDQKLDATNSFSFKSFSRKQLDWALRPVSVAADDFIKQSFDLLLNLSKRTILPLDFVAARSKAKYRVGPYTGNTFCYDMMIELPTRHTLDDFLRQAIFYLKKLRPEAAKT